MNHLSVKKATNSRDELMFWIHITANFNLQSLLSQKRSIFFTFLLLNKIKMDGWIIKVNEMLNLYLVPDVT